MAIIFSGWIKNFVSAASFLETLFGSFVSAAKLCFCCKLFGNSLPSLGSDGVYDLKNVGMRLIEHEKSKVHMMLIEQCLELKNCLKENA